jgi:hypothetical protein
MRVCVLYGEVALSLAMFILVIDTTIVNVSIAPPS